MIFAKKSKSAMMTIEIIASVALVIVVIFFALGLFSNNLRDMFVRSNFKNVYENEDQRIANVSFNKDYSSTQINVATTGTEGLGKIRQLANNKSLDIIEKSGGTPVVLTSSEGNALVYMKEIIILIVTSGDICNTMKKESTQLCKDIDAGNNFSKYNIELTGTSIKVKNIMSGETVATASGIKALPVYTSSSVWGRIKELSNAYGDSSLPIPDLERQIAYFSNKLQNNTPGQQFKEELLALLDNFKSRMTAAHDDCTCSPANGLWEGCKNIGTDQIPDLLGGTNYCNKSMVSFEERNDINKRVDSWIEKINSSKSSTTSNYNLLKIVTDSSDYSHVTSIAMKDRVESPSAYVFLTNGINELKIKYHITGPNNYSGLGGYNH